MVNTYTNQKTDLVQETIITEVVQMVQRQEEILFVQVLKYENGSSDTNTILQEINIKKTDNRFLHLNI